MGQVMTATTIPATGTVCHARCGTTFLLGKGRVPEVEVMYNEVRRTRVEKRLPLNRLEILSMEFCDSCARDRLFEKFGIKMFPTSEALLLMERWAQSNAWNMTERREQRAGWERVERVRSLEAALYRPDNRGIVNKVFSEATPRVEKANPKHRVHKHSSKPSRNPDAPKKYGDSRIVASAPAPKKRSKKNKKGKGGDDQKQGGKKGR